MNKRLHAKQFALMLSLALFAGTASAKLGYLSTTRDTVVTSGTGLCWRTSAWTMQHAVPQCDPVARVEAPAPPPIAAAPESEPVKPVPPAPPPQAAAPAPEPGPGPVAPAPVIHRVSLSTELLFEFDSARLRPGGEEKLRELAKAIKGAQLERLSAIGHADRIGTDHYNLELSRRRADSVRDYLSELGIETKRVHTAGRGEDEPLTDGACKGLRGVPLIACLQPDRRVEIEVRGHRTVMR